MQARINGISINYEISGPASGPPVVLHHPLATNLNVWDELTAALERAGYRVIRFDARGHGKTEAPAGPYEMEALATDTLELMDHLGVAKARYVGLSMGGFVGQVMAIKHPDRFHCLVLASTSSDMTEGRAFWNMRIETATREGMSKALIDGSIPRWVAPESVKSKPQVVDRLTGMVAATPVAGYVGWCHAISNFNVAGRLAGVKGVPVKVIVGALDPATTPAMAQTIHKLIAGSEYAEVPGTAHMLHIEDPDLFSAEVLPFLAKHGPRP
jgi:3-oxoadipate enol-lactonase